MKAFFSSAQLAHRPQQFMIAGRMVPPFETPDRALSLSRSLAAAGLEIEEPQDLGSGPIAKVHTQHFLEFLETAYDKFRQLPNAGPEAIPNVHPYASARPDFRERHMPRPTGIIGQLGWYVGDLSSPIGEGTWQASYASAQSAMSAASIVRDGTRQAMALCRPPGHHAYADRVSGFCYLNNAAIAAEILRQRFNSVAILDFDTHHGDGTQAIFYSRSDVFVGSLHTEPSAYYPFFTGYADEAGVGAGLGANLNIPLAPGTTDDGLIDAAKTLVSTALAFGAEAIVISAGWDAHGDDPLSRLAITDDAYIELGRLFGNVPLPTVIVQEGGYSLTAIERVAPSFLRHFLVNRSNDEIVI